MQGYLDYARITFQFKLGLQNRPFQGPTILDHFWAYLSLYILPHWEEEDEEDSTIVTW